MTRTISYKGYTIRSLPFKLDHKFYKFSIDGRIERDTGDKIIHYHKRNLDKYDIPDNELSEEAADETFIKYAKKFIDELT